MSRFIHSNTVAWRLLRLASILGSAVIAAQVVNGIMGRHCTESAIAALSLGIPLGLSTAVGALSYARHQEAPRTTAVALGVLSGSCVACSVTASNLFGAIDRGKQKYTMKDMREIARAIEEGRTVEGRTDGWGTRYQIQRTSGSYSIVSFGDCGVPDLPTGTVYSDGTTNSFKDDIVLVDGQFIRYPKGLVQ